MRTRSHVREYGDYSRLFYNPYFAIITEHTYFEHTESEAILDQCAVKQFHHLDGMDETWATEFGLNYAQMRFVQDAIAIPGNEDAGYSEALVGV